MDIKKIQALAGIIPLTEARSKYEDSADFTDELEAAAEHISKFALLVSQKRWGDWMKITDQNYSTALTAKNAEIVKLANELNKKFIALDKELMSAE